MMDAEVVRNFLSEFAEQFKEHPFVPDPTNAINNLANQVSSANVRISGPLNQIASVLERAGQNLLESTLVFALQEENAALVAENTALLRKQNQLIQVIKDLASPCVGCKKDKWQPHASDCDWSSDIFELLDRLANGPLNTRADQKAG